MQCDDSRACTVLAWRGWNDEIAVRIEDYYHSLYSEDVHFFWVNYTGGSDFISQLHTLNKKNLKCDVVIADREILQSFAVDGRLVPLSITGGEARTLLQQYPEWLRPWTIQSNEYIFAVPIRWGITSVFVKKDYLKHVTTKSMSNLLNGSPTTLIWSPKGYFLPSMGLMAMAVSPKRPFILSPKEFNSLKRHLEVLAERETHVIQRLWNFGKAVENMLPEVITCAGDWIIDSTKLYERNIYSLITDKYEYIYPEGSRPLVFFEMAAVLSSGSSNEIGVNLVKLLIKKDVRKLVEKISLRYGSYVSNPTTDEGKVIGPGWEMYPAREILNLAAPRSLPRNFQLQPAAPEWREVWLNTIMPRDGEGLVK